MWITTTSGPRTQQEARRARRRWIAAALLVGSVLAGCGAPEGASPPRPGHRAADAVPAAAAPSGPVVIGVAEPQGDLAVRSDHDLAIFQSPAAAQPFDVLWARNSFGSPLVLMVTHVGEGAWAGWFEILVPGRPNGRTAWVRDEDVTVNEVEHEVLVDTAGRTLTVVSDGQVVLSTPVAVGKEDSPTPTGRFSITDKLDTGQPDGSYGPFALGLSARSNSLTEFAGGDAQVGIHGTNDPSSIGRAASHGCIRVPNEVIVQLTDLLALGTPVTVT